jgi:tetratricopeptide (TPR) repeat protein
MELNHHLNHLKELLLQIGNYYGASADFVRIFGKKIGRPDLHRKTFNDILKGQIKFERVEWACYLPAAYDSAHQILTKYQEKTAKEQRRKSQEIQPQAFFNLEHSVKFVEETVHNTDFLTEKGEMTTSLKIITNLNDFINVEHIYSNNPYLYGYFHLVFAKIQMQFGMSEGSIGSLPLAQKSRAAFEKLEKEPIRLLQSINLQGHVFRQLNQYDKALTVFKETQALAQTLPLKSPQKEKFFMNTQHQIALTLMRQGEIQQKQPFFEEAKRLFQVSNSFYKNSEDENWYKFAQMREAELYIKSGDIANAEKILDIYEDPCEITLLTRSKIAIFHRINAERYLKNQDLKNALRYFKAAVTLSSEENYKHELEHLSKLYRNYDLLQKNLPLNFSVYQPIWR